MIPTHVVERDTPYYQSSPAQGRPPDGTLTAGTKVVVRREQGSYTQVERETGGLVFVERSALTAMPSK